MALTSAPPPAPPRLKGASGGGVGVLVGASSPCAAHPRTRPLKSLDKCLLSTACSPVLHRAQPPVLEARGPQTSQPQQGQQGREAATAAAVRPMGSGHSCCLFCMVWGTGHCHHPPTHFHHRGEQGRAQSWGPTVECRALVPTGQPWDVSWEGPTPGPPSEDRQPHTHRCLRPLSSGSGSPRSSSGSWQLQASSAGGGASRSGCVSAERLRSAGRPDTHLSHPRGTTDLGATRAAVSAARRASPAGPHSGPGRRRSRRGGRRSACHASQRAAAPGYTRHCVSCSRETRGGTQTGNSWDTQKSPRSALAHPSRTSTWLLSSEWEVGRQEGQERPLPQELATGRPHQHSL